MFEHVSRRFEGLSPLWRYGIADRQPTPKLLAIAFITIRLVCHFCSLATFLHMKRLYRLCPSWPVKPNQIVPQLLPHVKYPMAP